MSYGIYGRPAHVIPCDVTISFSDGADRKCRRVVILKTDDGWRAWYDFGATMSPVTGLVTSSGFRTARACKHATKRMLGEG